MKCFRCGSENTTTKPQFHPDTGLEAGQIEHQLQFVPVILGNGPLLGPDTKVTLCQSCAGQQIAFLKGDPIPQVPRVLQRSLEDRVNT